MFAASDTFQLTVDPVQDADSLNDEFSLRLRSTESIDTGARYRGTVIDDDPLATATFSRTDIKIFEGSEAQLSVRVAAPEGESFPTQAGDQNIVLSVTPAAAVDVEECPTDRESRYALRIWSETETVTSGPGRGEVTIDKSIANYQRGPAESAAHRVRRHVGFPGFRCHAGVRGLVAADARRQDRERTAGNDSDPE